MEAWVDTLCLLAQPKEGQQQFKNKKQPELTENQTVWKSDNQGDKEETFIQTCRQRLVDPTRWHIVEWGGQNYSWLARQQLVDPVTDCATQSSSSGK